MGRSIMKARASKTSLTLGATYSSEEKRADYAPPMLGNGEIALQLDFMGQMDYDVAEADAKKVADRIADNWPDCDVECLAGGQPLYYYLISVE